MMFFIENCPFFPFDWMKLKLSEHEYTNYCNSLCTDFWVKISNGKHYLLTSVREDGLNTLTLEVRDCLGDFIDSFTKIPCCLSHDDERFPLSISELIIHRKSIYVNSNMILRESKDNVKISVPSYFRVVLDENSVVQNFELKNMTFSKEKSALEYVAWHGIHRSELNPSYAMLSALKSYDINYNGIQHLKGTKDEVSITSYDSAGNPVKRDTYFNSKDDHDTFYVELLHNILHFNSIERELHVKSNFCRMLKDLESIKNMEPKYCEQQRAFNSFHERWVRCFNIKTPRSYDLK
jgi:hypothetical protein